MSSLQERLAALQEERENLVFRIEELERSVRAEKEVEARRAEFQHKEDLENIALLRQQFLVTSNPALVRMLDNLVQEGLTPHMLKSSWSRCENSEIRMYNVTNGICLPQSCRGSWSGGITYVSGFFSYNSDATYFDKTISYSMNTMIDFGLVYRNGIEERRKGLVLKGGAILQLRPEKKTYESLNAWIEEMERPTFGVVRVCIYDPRTRHQKAQEKLNAMDCSFEQKIVWLMQHYKLKQKLRFWASPKKRYEIAVVNCEQEKARVKQNLAQLNLGAPEAGNSLARWGRWLKGRALHVELSLGYMNSLSEEDRNKSPITLSNRWNSYLYVKDASGHCVVAEDSLSVYHQCHKDAAAVRKWVPQGPTQVFLWWRMQEIVFNV